METFTLQDTSPIDEAKEKYLAPDLVTEYSYSNLPLSFSQYFTMSVTKAQYINNNINKGNIFLVLYLLIFIILSQRLLLNMAIAIDIVESIKK